MRNDENVADQHFSPFLTMPDLHEDRIVLQRDEPEYEYRQSLNTGERKTSLT